MHCVSDAGFGERLYRSDRFNYSFQRGIMTKCLVKRSRVESPIAGLGREEQAVAAAQAFYRLGRLESVLNNVLDRRQALSIVFSLIISGRSSDFSL